MGRAYLRVYIKQKYFSEGFLNLYERNLSIEEDFNRLSKDEILNIANEFKNDAKKYNYNIGCKDEVFLRPHLLSHLKPIIAPLDLAIIKGEVYIANSFFRGEYPYCSMENKFSIPKEWTFLFKKEDEVEFEEIILGDTIHKVREFDYIVTVKEAMNRIIDTDFYMKHGKTHSFYQWLSSYPNDSLVTLQYNELFIYPSFDENEVKANIK